MGIKSLKAKMLRENYIHRPMIGVGFIIYRSEVTLKPRLQMLNELKIPFYLYDNSPEISEIYFFASSLAYCNYLTDGMNLGLGVGLKRICSQAHKDGLKALLFFDQDTSFTVETIHYAQHLIDESYHKLADGYSAICLSDKIAKSNDSNLLNILNESDLIINSGSVFILDNLSKIGWHNSTYFVDGVDYEFCFRSHQYGFKLGLCYSVPGFDHVSEQPDEVVKIFGKSLLIRRYSRFRIKDALHSYMRLIYTAFISGQFSYAAKFSRSLLIYLLGLTLSRILLA